MMKNKFWLLLLFFSTAVLAQSEMTYINGTALKATTEWELVNDDYAYGSFVFQIGKTANGGILKVSAEVSDANFSIGGNLYIDFKDATYIICTDKNLRSFQDNKAVAFYVLTTKEMELLKAKPISSIRFKIIGNQTVFSSKTGHFTAYNFKNSLAKILQKDYLFETNIEVQKLFKS